MRSRIVHSDSLDELKKIPSNYVDCLVTDPPYGYSFMGKDWDKAVPSVELWKECLRVLKHGGFAFIMSAPRSDVLSRMIVRIEDAGFRVDFTPIYWTYASGFPKAMNIGKMVDKRDGTERKVVSSYKSGEGANFKHAGNGKPQLHEAAAKTIEVTKGTSPLEGSYGGFQPKPAVEVVIVAMKPLSEKTFVDQALKNGKGITWLDAARIPHDVPPKFANRTAPKSDGTKMGEFAENGVMATPNEEGRFPANLLVSDDVLNDGRVQKSGRAIKHNSGGENFGGGKKPLTEDMGYADSGSYSRYFDLDAWWAKTYPFLIVPKASKAEKNSGLEGMPEKIKPLMGDFGTNPGRATPKSSNTARANFHPTVKPLKLMSYLITLGTREGDTVLDPFLGSGTTAIAAKMLGRNYLGIEREKEYIDIAKARLDAVTYQPTLLAAE